MFEQLISGFQAMSYWEYIAAALGVAYIFLAMKQSLWCWPAAFVSTFIYTLLFWQGFLYMESFLNFYYLIMAVYGWWQWRGSIAQPVQTSEQKKVQRWSAKLHLISIAACSAITIVLAYVLDNYTQARMPYLDSFTTVFAVFTTYLVTQKVLENWLYWIVINLASIYLYFQNGYLPTAALFVLYVGLAVQGYRAWNKDLQSNG
jgi:nicotinamide mononucleotide transporter